MSRGAFLGVILFAACGGGGGDGTTGDAGHDAGGGSDASTDAAHDAGGPTDLGVDLPGCADADGDGHAAASCGGDDCDDADPHRFPGNHEVCDAFDQDCDPSTLGPDMDSDGFPATTCCNPQPGGGMMCGTDCNDAAATINPTAAEACNGIDDNCNGMVDEGVQIACYVDADTDGFAAAGAAPMMMCSCGSGLTATNPATSADCNDGNGHVFPGAAEICNGIDDDCDGVIDDGMRATYYRDVDGDGHGSAASGTTVACTLPTGYSPDNTDCNDACATCYVGHVEICDGFDNDCNGLTDENLGAPCSAGIGACATMGQLRCDATCTAVPGTPDSTFHTMVAPNGSWDWNCDGVVTGQYSITDFTDYSAATYCGGFSSPSCGTRPEIFGLQAPAADPAPYCGVPIWGPILLTGFGASGCLHMCADAGLAGSPCRATMAGFSSCTNTLAGTQGCQ